MNDSPQPGKDLVGYVKYLACVGIGAAIDWIWGLF